MEKLIDGQGNEDIEMEPIILQSTDTEMGDEPTETRGAVRTVNERTANQITGTENPAFEIETVDEDEDGPPSLTGSNLSLILMEGMCEFSHCD